MGAVSLCRRGWTTLKGPAAPLDPAPGAGLRPAQCTGSAQIDRGNERVSRRAVSVPQEIEWLPRPQGSRGSPRRVTYLIFLFCRCVSTVVAVEGIRHRHAVSGVTRGV